jgi:SAM-dependent methyltransferase
MASSLREMEAASIRTFVQQAADQGFLSGRVLDYGCGKQPYRDIVEAAGGDYQAFDAPEFPGNVGGKRYTPNWPHKFDAVLCTQVLQYVPQPRLALKNIARQTEVLILTYPTNWPEVEDTDLHRFTKAGMQRLLTETGFEIIRHDWRHGFRHNGDSFTVGYGVVARA